MNYFSNSKLKATGFFKPYSPEGNYNLKTTGCGVYIIKEGERVVYVGIGRKDLRNTLYRHFQQWTDKRTVAGRKYTPYERITYSGNDREKYLIKVIFCKGIIEAEIIEQLLIKKLKPRDNSLKLYLYSKEDYNKADIKINEAQMWKSNFEENPF